MADLAKTELGESGPIVRRLSDLRIALLWLTAVSPVPSRVSGT